MSKKRMYAQQSLNWIDDPRCEALGKPCYKWLNNVLWVLCVREQTEVLPPRFNAAYLARKSGLDKRTVGKGLTLMSSTTIDLIRILDDNSIHVLGVADIHETANFKFKRIKSSKKNIDVHTDVDIDVYIEVPTDVYMDGDNRTEQNTTKKSRIGEEPNSEEATKILEMFPGMKTVNTWLNKYSDIPVKTILEEVQNAHEWKQNQKDSKKRKTANPTAFLTKWIGRCGDKLKVSKMDPLNPSDTHVRAHPDWTYSIEDFISFGYDHIHDQRRDGKDPLKDYPYPLPDIKTLKKMAAE